MKVKNRRRVLSICLLLVLSAPVVWAGKGILVGAGGSEPLLRVVRMGERIQAIGYGTVISRITRELIILRNREVISFQEEGGESFLLQRDVATEAQFTPFLTALNLSRAGSRNETCRSRDPGEETRITWYGPRRSTERVLLDEASLPLCTNQAYHILTAAESLRNNVLRDASPPVQSGFFARNDPAAREITGQVLCGTQALPMTAKVELYAQAPLRCEFEVCLFNNNVSPLFAVPVGADGRFSIRLPQAPPSSPLYVLVQATPQNVQACGGEQRSYLTFPVPAEPAGSFEVRLNGFF